MRVLLVEDTIRVADAVADVLRKQNMDVDIAYDGETGLSFARSIIYDAIVLDIILPSIDGLLVTKTLRNEGIKTPIILLTAKSLTDDKVLGLNTGADDYLTKPFETSELVARIRAITRRNIGADSSGNQTLSDLVFSPQTLTVSCGSTSMILNLKAAQVLEILLANQETLVPKDVILHKLWGFDANAAANYVEVQVSILRRVLLELDTKVAIRTVRGIGYIISEV